MSEPKSYSEQLKETETKPEGHDIQSSYLKWRATAAQHGFYMPYTFKFHYYLPDAYGKQSSAAAVTEFDYEDYRHHPEQDPKKTAEKIIIHFSLDALHRPKKAIPPFDRDKPEYFAYMRKNGISETDAYDAKFAYFAFHEVGHARTIMQNDIAKTSSDPNYRPISFLQTGPYYDKNNKPKISVGNAAASLYAEAFADAYAILNMRREGYTGTEQLVKASSLMPNSSWTKAEQFARDNWFALDANMNIVPQIVRNSDGTEKAIFPPDNIVEGYLTIVSQITGDAQTRALNSKIDLSDTVALENEAKKIAIDIVNKTLKDHNVDVNSAELQKDLKYINNIEVCSSSQSFLGPDFDKKQNGLLNRFDISKLQRFNNGRCNTDIITREPAPNPK